MKKLHLHTNLYLLILVSLLFSCSPSIYSLLENNNIGAFEKRIKEVDINIIPNDKYMTVLTKACLWGDTVFVKACLNAGADVNRSLSMEEDFKRPFKRVWDVTMDGAHNFSYQTLNQSGSGCVNYKPLSGALKSEENNLSIVALLLEKDATINFTYWEEFFIITDFRESFDYFHFQQKDEYFLKITPLIKAVEKKQSDIVKLLISKGADVNMQNSNGKSPLIYAIDNKDYEMIKLLLENGASIKLTDTWTEIHKEKPTILQKYLPYWESYILTEEKCDIETKLKQINDENISMLIKQKLN